MRKNRLMLFTSIAMMLCFGGSVSAAPSELISKGSTNAVYASASASTTAVKAADDYFSSMNAKIDAGLIDSSAPLLNYKIVSVDASDPNNVKLEVETEYADGVGKLPAAPYYAVLENGGYHIEPAENLVYNMAPGTPEYGTVSTDVPIESAQPSKDGSIISPRVITLGYYQFVALANSGIHEMDHFGKFSTTNGKVTINGWQEFDTHSQEGNASVQNRYGIGTYLGGSFVNLAVSQPFYGNYPHNGTWFSAYLNVATGRERFVFVKSEGGASLGEGNAYEN